MASFNGKRFIKQQIESILSQIGPSDELIVSDDGSIDGTLEMLSEISKVDPRVKVIKHHKDFIVKSDRPGNSFYSVTENFENALSNAAGDYIFLSDQDDIWLPGKVATCLEHLKKFDCVVHNYQEIDINGNLIKEREFSKIPIHKTFIMNICNMFFRGCCIAFNRKILEKSLPIPKDVIGHDYWISSMASHYGKVFYEMKPLIQSRQHEDSVSAKRKTSLTYKINYRVVLIYRSIQRFCEI